MHLADCVFDSLFGIGMASPYYLSLSYLRSIHIIRLLLTPLMPNDLKAM